MAWAMEECLGAALGDLRLTKRLIRWVDDLSAEPMNSLPVACGGWAETKAAYRLLDNDAMDWWAILAAHGRPTVARMGWECPELPCDVAFSAEEWRAAWLIAKRQPPPYAPPTLGAMIRWVAGFGGFLGRQGDGHPGPKPLWEGLMKLMAYVEALQRVHAVYGTPTTCGYWGAP